MLKDIISIIQMNQHEPNLVKYLRLYMYQAGFIHIISCGICQKEYISSNKMELSSYFSSILTSQICINYHLYVFKNNFVHAQG